MLLAHSPLVLLLLLLLLVATSTLQVDISLQWWSEGMSYFDNLVTARWDNVPPGTCCKPSPSHLPSLNNHRASETRLIDLLQNQFGAGWAATGFDHSDIVECSGVPLMRVLGPGSLSGGSEENTIAEYHPPWGEDERGTPQNVVFAASWVDPRVSFPPGSEEVRYLSLQGVKGAVWGANTWSAASDGVPFPRKEKRRRWLNGRGVQRGTAYLAAPRRWVLFPSVYVVNRTEYMNDGNGTYRNSGGESLEHVFPFA
ncbi:MAG: hypothetical protein Q9222_003292 [Ikaeria aurantiellina]